jgi:hypothetical protein
VVLVYWHAHYRRCKGLLLPTYECPCILERDDACVQQECNGEPGEKVWSGGTLPVFPHRINVELNDNSASKTVEKVVKVVIIHFDGES